MHICARWFENVLADKPRFPSKKHRSKFSESSAAQRGCRSKSRPLWPGETQRRPCTQEESCVKLSLRDSLTAAVDKPNRESKARLSPSVDRFAHGAHGRRLADALRFPRSRAAATGCILGFGPTERDLRRRSSTDARAGRNE